MSGLLTIMGENKTPFVVNKLLLKVGGFIGQTGQHRTTPDIQRLNKGCFLDIMGEISGHYGGNKWTLWGKIKLLFVVSKSLFFYLSPKASLKLY